METLLNQPSSRLQRRFGELAKETLRRQNDALRLYRPIQTTLPAHLSKAKIRVILGGNQSSKTTTFAAEFASAATGIPLCNCDGNPIPFQYPTNRPLLLWITGYDENHIGSTIYKKLFAPGAFDVIKDSATGQYRVWQPWLPDDKEREAEKQPAEPLIPERFIKRWAWQDLGKHSFTVCQLQNGTEIWAFPSAGNAPQGQKVDLIWIDEDIVYPGHVAEWIARLPGVRGRFIWSAWPHSANEALVDLVRKAEEQQGQSKPDVEFWRLRFEDNPFFDEDEKRMTIKLWGPELAASRNEGQFSSGTQLVFPTFSLQVHGLEGTGCTPALAAELAKNNYQPGRDWTNFLVLDPGTVQPAVLYATIPPARFGDHVVIFDETYTPNCDANEIARQVQSKASHLVFEAFLIDFRAGRKTPEGFGKTIKQQYTEAFTRHHLVSRLTQSSFLDGSDNITARNMQARAWMAPRDGGTTKLIVVDAKTYNFQRETRLYKKRIRKDEVIDDVVQKHDHLMSCLGYLAAYDPKWTWHGEEKPKEPTGAEWLTEWYKTIGVRRKKDPEVYSIGAGPALLN